MERSLRPSSKRRTELLAVEGDTVQQRADHVATEEPMEIRLVAAGERRTVAITMRTPGNDFELAVGFLFSEGIITSREQIHRVSYCVEPDVDAEQRYNVVQVTLRDAALPDLKTLDRHFYTTSACGVCGKASLDAVRRRGGPVLPPGPEVTPEVLAGLPEKLRAAQGIFEATGGLHAAGLFDAGGNIVVLREDVGRHNAMDKLVGWALLEGGLPLHGRIVMASGRASFELLQKSYTAGVPIFCAVSAPSSLAVDLSREFGITLIGFLRGHRFNVYAGAERIRPLPRALLPSQ
jgi:FdhD protein